MASKFSVQLAERAFVESDERAEVALEPGMKNSRDEPDRDEHGDDDPVAADADVEQPHEQAEDGGAHDAGGQPDEQQRRGEEEEPVAQRVTCPTSATGRQMAITIIMKNPNENGSANVLTDRRNPPLKRSTELYS